MVNRRMWSKINQRESLWEKATGKEYGFENRTARTRRQLRECVDTEKETVPDTRRRSKPLTRAEKRQVDKILREGKKR